MRHSWYFNDYKNLWPGHNAKRWKNINKTQNLDVYDKVILKYPPEIKKLEIVNNIDIIRKTLVRFAAPLIFFMLII